MSKVYKYNIDWQVTRVKAKDIKDIDDKLEYISSFYKKHKNKENQERIINWAKGLKIAYPKSKIDIHSKIDLFIDEISETSPQSTEHSHRGVDTKALRKYSDTDIFDVLKDLTTRNDKWLKEGYVNGEANEFIGALIDYLEIHKFSKVTKIKESYDALLKHAKTIPNTYKWHY